MTGDMSATPVVVGDQPDWRIPDFVAEERDRRDRLVRTVADAVVVAVCAVFVFAELYPTLLLSSPVPAGGDMGAHVWGPAFLRDHLLPDLRLSGWTQAWYAGFPAYQFYMVIPSLLIVVLDVGVFAGWAALLPLVAAGALGVMALDGGPGRRRQVLLVGAVVLLAFGVALPYGVAFKLVTVLGVVAMPVAAYAFGRLADLPFPAPSVLAVATLPFLFNRNFTIWGGNIASTLAGEFAFSIGLSVALVYLGVVVRGLRTGRHRALGAGLLALTGLCHIIPAFFAIGVTVVLALFHFRRATVVWLAWVGPVAGLLSAFWVLPFVWQRDYVNDMGWEKIPYLVESNGYSQRLSETLFTFGGETYWRYLIPTTGAVPEGVPISAFADDMRWVLGLAVAGVVLSVAFRVRIGLALGASAACTAAAFVLLPEGRLWNARVLPFYYLCLYLLAGLAIALAGRTATQLWTARPERESVAGSAATAGASLVVTLVLVALPLGTLPLGVHRADGTYAWFGFEVETSFIRPWARWNYSGYEGKPAYAEYRDLMLEMEDVGERNGCGRAFWEYSGDLNRYGTSMALMLLPHWTDGCIGSMEGLYFEASATTPFHFLVQSELSAAPSRAQRDLPYSEFDLDLGVRHLQLLGVRYYMASSTTATAAAATHPRLTEIASSGPWTIYEVDRSDIVQPLRRRPAVMDGVGHGQHDWICRTVDRDDRCSGPAIEWFNDPGRWHTVLASSGPESWDRVAVDQHAPGVPGPGVAAAAVIDELVPRRVPLPRARVSDVVVEENRIAFHVDRVDVPVLVKASYFPNWRVSGGEGPYRVAPNLMVVVPTDEQVELTFGREPVDWLAWLVTAVGLGLVIVLARARPLRVPVDDRDR
jgi:hypothetical protein